MSDQTTRRRDAAATREAILESAAILFAERGFERTTVRDIGVHAGVNQALLFRYFGSKTMLFEEVTARRAHELLVSSAPEKLLEDSLRGMFRSDTPDRRHRALDALLRSAGSDSAAGTISHELGDAYARTLATLTARNDAALRADLVLAWLLGIGLLRKIRHDQPLADADPDRVCELVLAAARTLLEDIAPDSPK